MGNNKMIIIGLDISLTGTGVVVLENENVKHELLIKSKPPIEKNNVTEIERLTLIRDKMISVIKENPPDLVVIEGMAFMAKGTSLTQLSYLNYAIRAYLWENHIRFLLVAPPSLKKFITGHGKAEKEEIMEIIFTKYHIAATDNNIADAFSLAVIGRTFLMDSAVEKHQKEVLEILKKQL
jgi:crossover junction endodeoxyribonuclease RuvC